MLTWEYHGGGCCGRYHIHNFYHNTSQPPVANQLKAAIKEIVNDVREDRNPIEVVLNGIQVPAHEHELFAVGFKLVHQFTNFNTGNECYMYLLDVEC